VKFVVLYESADGVRERAPAHYDAHLAHMRAFHERGDLLLMGPFEDPQQDGAMGVFTTREAAEAFAADDPFVLGGVVRRWEVRGWNEIFVRTAVP
jgi:uncharacterized protein YciI